MALYLLEDVRSEDDDLRLKNSEAAEEILQYLPPQTSTLPRPSCKWYSSISARFWLKCEMAWSTKAGGITSYKKGWDALEEHRDLGRCEGASINGFDEISGIRLATQICKWMQMDMWHMYNGCGSLCRHEWPVL
jgi:hypothetical protein